MTGSAARESKSPPLLHRAKTAVLNAFEQGGGLKALRWISRRTPRILLYHRFAPRDTPRDMGVSTFERQIEFLKRKFRIFPLSDLVARKRAGEVMPANAAAITVDDGYEDFYLYAYPVLKRHGVPATFYVVSEFVEGRQWLWPDLIEHVVRSTRHPEVSFDLGPNRGRWALGSEAERIAAWSDIADHCLTLEPEDTQELTISLAEKLEVEIPASPSARFRASSWEQLREMAGGGVEIGSHTCTHPRLSLASDETLQSEIRGSKREIESRISRPVVSFAYPHGAKGDFDARCEAAVAAAGYASAVAGYFDPDVLGDAFAVKRASSSPNWNTFLRIVYGLEHLQHALRPQRGDGRT